MNNSAYLAVDVEECRARQHKFRLAGSDKTPLKRSLICLTCSERTGKSAYAAYGVEALSFGVWRNSRPRETAIDETLEPKEEEAV